MKIVKKQFYYQSKYPICHLDELLSFLYIQVERISYIIMDTAQVLRQQFLQNLLDLATDEGINASGREEIYGCIFGRDSAITILKILKAVSHPSFSSYETEELLTISRRALLTLVRLQGKRTNIESGEEPGKFIHEYRKNNYEHLVTRENPWYVYRDKILRSYDSVDSTPLALIALYNYWIQTNDTEFLLTILPAVEKGLNWIISYGDFDKDYILEYEFKAIRKHGGLHVQSWTDSSESLLKPDRTMPKYPIAPVEVQGYAWLALKLWSDFYANEKRQFAKTKRFSKKLGKRAEKLKKRFNETFILKDNGYYFAAQALDGNKNQIPTITGNPLLLLWATYKKNGIRESIIKDQYIEQFVRRAFLPDLFDADAGIRTMSSLSSTFDASTNSYHNGSFWPKLNGMVHEGLMNWEFTQEANLLRTASLKPFEYFKTPIELYIKTQEGYAEWRNASSGQTGCRVQAWSAAAGLDLLSY